MKIGQKIKLLRKERDMTLAELSKKSGVALATLCRMEKGKMTGTLESHANIAKALSVKLTDLLKEVEEEKAFVDIIKKRGKADVFEYNKNASYAILTTDTLNKNMMPLMMKLEPRGATHKEENRVGTEKFMYVLDGKVDVALGDKKYTLNSGDTLYFDASIPHQFNNTGKKQARLVILINSDKI